MGNREKALAAGLNRYFGRVCLKHPELNGLRNSRWKTCIGCQKHQRKKWQERKRLSETGFTKELEQRLMVIQKGLCAVCSRPLSDFSDRVHADHCHVSKKPRGLLCRSCNQAEGMIRETGVCPREFGNLLAEYLENPPAGKVGMLPMLKVEIERKARWRSVIGHPDWIPAQKYAERGWTIEHLEMGTLKGVRYFRKEEKCQTPHHRQ